MRNHMGKVGNHTAEQTTLLPRGTE
uniref:Uncharacterized protein n=1 Tax=Anguilla anguilla TaxID=7936 RepID=A0A0E9XBG5_ANGAN